MKMKSFKARKAAASAALLTVGAASAAFGQQSYLNSRVWEQASATRQKNSLENNAYNLRAGPVDFSFGAGMSLEYNSNIRNSQISPAADFIITPNVNANAVWVVTEINKLSLDLNVGYVKYIDHSEFDRMRVSPGSLSQIDYDFYVSIFRINVHDRFSYTSEVGSQSQLTGQASLGRFDNTLGVATSFHLKDWTISSGYDHSWDIYSSGFEDNSHESDMIFVRGGYEINPVVTVGAEASAGMTTYSAGSTRGQRGDSINYTAGPFVTWQITDHIALDARTGLSIYKQQRSSQFIVLNLPLTNPPTFRVVNDDSSPTGVYASVTLRHAVNRWFSHAVGVSRSTQQAAGVFSNYYESTDFSDTATFGIFEKVSLGTRVNYEIGKLSSSTLGENYTRFTIGASSSYRLSQKLTTTLSYDYQVRDSDTAGFNYDSHRAVLSLNYRF